MIRILLACVLVCFAFVVPVVAQDETPPAPADEAVATDAAETGGLGDEGAGDVADSDDDGEEEEEEEEDIFIPSEEIPPERELTFPVDI